MGHWYNKDGHPIYTIKRTDGKGERDTTLRDARKLHLVPSVTTINASIANEYLNTWKNNQLLECAKLSPFKSNYDEQKWKNMILKCSSAKGQEAAKEGTRVHDILEQIFLKTNTIESLSEKDVKIVTAVLDSVGGIIDVNSWFTEHSFQRGGVGGKIDLHHKIGKGAVLDFKTKAVDEFKKLPLYDSYAMQLAIYRWGLKLEQADCYNLFISTTNPGLVQLHKWTEEELMRGHRMFFYLLDFWYEQNKFVNIYKERE